jgi:hypothetical protein
MATKKKIIVVEDDDECVVPCTAPAECKTPGTLVRAPMVPYSMPRGKFEHKYRDFSYTGVLPAVGGTVCPVSLIDAGLEFSQRVGREIKYAYVDIHVLAGSGAVASSLDGVRVKVVLDTQSDGNNATWAEFCDMSTITNPYYAFPNIAAGLLRFHHLHEWYGPIDRVDTGVAFYSSQPRVHVARIRIPKKLALARYVSSSAAAPMTGNLLVCVANAINTGYGAYANVFVRVHFVDA